MTLNLASLAQASEKEGFCLLHTGHSVHHRGHTIIGERPKQKLKNWLKIKQYLKSLKNQKSNLPLANGLIGYFAYPNPTLSNKIPDLLFYQFDSLQHTQTIRIGRSNTTYKTSGRLQSSVTKQQYLGKIRQIHKLLAAGEVYQINTAIRFTKKFSGSPYALFLRLAKENPAQFSAYLNCGTFHIISASPERLFSVRNNKITTQPIKGTVSKKGDKTSLHYLLNSTKERAELDMITDLERNDVGKLCKYGTLKLTKEREVVELPNLWHTYSEIQGQLAPKTDEQTIMQAMFPGGSITGCPKIRAMRYIEELENMPRNIYTGSIGTMTRQGGKPKMDCSIAIRTILIQNGQLELWAGGGIVADSDPEKEYEECLLKAEKFLKVI